MGCFSYICKGCKTPIRSDSFQGEQCELFLLKDGKVIEHLSGDYNSYGRTFEQEWSVMEWGDIVEMDFNESRGDGIAAYHKKCRQGRIPRTISEQDPDQGWGDLRKKYLRDDALRLSIIKAICIAQAADANLDARTMIQQLDKLGKQGKADEWIGFKWRKD
jgi:hypothetical protein